MEVAFVLRDTEERREPLTLGPATFRSRAGLHRHPVGRPVGLPVDVLGQKSLAEGEGWRFSFTPGTDERGLAVPLALTFRITDAGGAYALAIKDFPPVTIDVPAADEKDEGKKKNPAAGHK